MSITSVQLKTSPAYAMAAYEVGETETRPWGAYTVTGAGLNAEGEEYCDKIITVRPGQALSLQSHELRRETWTVEKGTLAALIEDHRIELSPGDSVHIPAGSIHCMANPGDTDCVVRERQEGICREEDIRRYRDAYCRATDAGMSAEAAKSIAAYAALLSDINRKRAA